MPKVIPLGTSYNEFWTLNPRKIDVMIAAYNESKKSEFTQKNALMHLQGMYFADALLATVGNMFKGKGSKSFSYPKEPYKLNLDGKVEDDLEIQRRDFVTNLNNIFRNIDEAIKERDGNTSS